MTWGDMQCRIAEAKYVGNYRVALAFSDGREGVIDVRELHGPGDVFAPLLDEHFVGHFQLVRGTLSWPGELDVAPEYLYFLAFRNDPALQGQFVEWGYVAGPVKAGS